VLRTTQTDESGYYRFDDVLPSQAGTSYTITEQHPSTLVDGKDTIDDPLKGTSPANDTFTSEIPILGFDVAGSTVQMDFGELGFKAEFGVLNLYNLLHSGGTIDGLMFGTDGEGELQWFLNVGGWDGYVPGTAHSPYRVTIENNRLSLTDTRTSTVRTIDATDEAIRSLYRTSGLVMRIDGGAANFGLPLYDPPAEGEGEAYADAVDAVFAEAGA
jgi:hypothetical protein